MTWPTVQGLKKDSWMEPSISLVDVRCGINIKYQCLCRLL